MKAKELKTSGWRPSHEFMKLMQRTLGIGPAKANTAINQMDKLATAQHINLGQIPESQLMLIIQRTYQHLQKKPGAQVNSTIKAR